MQDFHGKHNVIHTFQLLNINMAYMYNKFILTRTTYLTDNVIWISSVIIDCTVFLDSDWFLRVQFNS